MNKITAAIAAENKYIQALTDGVSANIYDFLQPCGYNSLKEYIHVKIYFRFWVAKEVLSSNG